MHFIAACECATTAWLLDTCDGELLSRPNGFLFFNLFENGAFQWPFTRLCIWAELTWALTLVRGLVVARMLRCNMKMLIIY